jgi:hypothetical protein
MASEISALSKKRRHLSLFWTTCIQSLPFHVISLSRFQYYPPIYAKVFRGIAIQVYPSKFCILFTYSQWSRFLRRGSAAARLLGLWVQIPPGGWMSVSCECYVLSGRGLCVGLINHPEESYRMFSVSECDREASKMRRPWPTRGCCTIKKHIWRV